MKTKYTELSNSELKLQIETFKNIFESKKNEKRWSIEMKTVYEGGEGEIVEKKSRFIASVYKVINEDEAISIIEQLKKKYWDARHNCHAFVIGKNAELMRFSDDGEPHSTAGLPVMEVIDHLGITDIAVVVTRYFGGILLGTGGLVRAYSDSARTVLETAEVVTILPAKQVCIRCDYGDYDLLTKLLSEFEVKIISTDFNDKVEVTLAVKATLFDDLAKKCTDKFSARIPIPEPKDIFMGF